VATPELLGDSEFTELPENSAEVVGIPELLGVGEIV